MSRFIRFLTRAVPVVILVVVCAAAWRAYSRPRTTSEWDKAQAALAAGDRNAAVVHLRTVVRENPNHGEAYLAVSKLFLDRAEMDGRTSTYAENERAFPFFVQAARLLPQNVPLQQQLLTIYLDRGQTTEALEVAGRIADKLPYDSDIVAMQAQLVVSQYERAAEGLTKVLASNKASYFQALELRAKIDVAAENMHHLQLLFDDVLERAGAKYAQSIAAAGRREHAAMARLIRLAVAEAPDTVTAERRMQAALDAWNRLAHIESGSLEQQELIADAADEASWLAATYARQYAAEEGASSASADFEEQAEAIRQFAVDAEAIRSGARMISVQRAFKSGNVKGAADLAAQGIETANNRAEALQLRLAAGRLYVLARSSEADRQIHTLKADREWAGYGHLLAGDQALLAGKPRDALTHFRAVLPLLGHTREVRAGLADAFLALGRWEEARAELSGLTRRVKETDSEKPALGELPHRALLLKLYQASPDISEAELAAALLGAL